MNVLKVFGIVRKALSKITDLLLIGRENGWWDKQKPEVEKADPENYI